MTIKALIIIESTIMTLLKDGLLNPTLMKNTIFKDMFLTTNSQGLRGEIEYSYAKNPDKTRILKKGTKFIIGHWSPIGHLTVAEGINQYLMQKEYIKKSTSPPSGY